MKANHYTMVARNAIKESLKDIPKTSNIGFGCSGGADSTAILLALSTLYKGERASQVHVVIVDHQLQEVTSKISRNVEELALSYGFTPHVIPVDIKETAAGAESDAREARYEAFRSIINKFDLKAFFTGHTKSDQAEQVMLGILRGSGSRSLSGIRESREVYKRPFLNSLTREETQKVCEENNYSYWNDPHNDLLIYKRVAVRKFIQEFEKKTSQKIVEPLVRTAAINAEDADALDFYAENEYSKIQDSGWSITELEKLPASIRKRLYRKKLNDFKVKTDSINFIILSAIDEFISDWRGQGEVVISKTLSVSRKNSTLAFNSK